MEFTKVNPSPDTDVILHCFHMRYNDIDTYLKKLKSKHLITHIQLPPVQPHRVFTTHDHILEKKTDTLVEDLTRDIQTMVSLFNKGQDDEYLYFFAQHISFFMNTPIVRNFLVNVFNKYNEKDPQIRETCETIQDIKLNKSNLPLLQKHLTTLLQFYKFDYDTFVQVFKQQFVDIPPWFAIYQPKGFRLGDTMYGTKNELQTLLQKHDFHFMADVVLNHLQGVQYEWQEWDALLKECKAYQKTPLMTIQDCRRLPHTNKYPNHLWDLLTDVVEEAFSEKDLTIINPPYYCHPKEEATNCWLSQALPQVNQVHPTVIEAQDFFFKELRQMGFDSLRLDAAGHMRPEVCERILKTFQPSFAYAEVFEPDGRYTNEDYSHRMPTIDVNIGAFLLNKVFRYGGNLELLKNIEPPNRVDNPHCVVAILTHDMMAGSFGTPIQYTTTYTDYCLAMAYLCQRIYGIPLLLPFDLESDLVITALEVRHKNKVLQITHEYNLVHQNVFISEKKNKAGEIKLLCFLNNTNSDQTIPLLNLSQKSYTVSARSFEYIEVEENVTLLDYGAKGGKRKRKQKTRKHKRWVANTRHHKRK